MKKRKELDALLLNNMNGKKLNKGSGSGKEGHELLRSEASWDSNSTENDEFFAPPRRMVIKKPHKWRICATSLQLCIFVVMVACIVVTGGLVWMHLDLKQDLDELRLRIAKVESELETSTEQASTVSTLQLKIEELQRLPAHFNSIIKQINHLNSTYSQLQHDVKGVRDEIKALPTPSIEGLKKSTAQIGSTMQGVQGLQTQHTQQINTLTSTLDQIQISITELQGETARLPQETPTTTPKSGSRNPASATGNPGSFLDVGKTIQKLQEDQEETTSNLRRFNTTVISVLHWKDDLIPRITALESGVHTSDPSDSSLALKVAQLQSQIDVLRNSTRSQASGTEGHSETPSITSSDWTHNIESEIQEIQQQLKELNPKDLNNNLLNPNVTLGLQHQIERALSVFKEENLKSVDYLKEQDQALWGRLYQQHTEIAAVEQKVEDLRVRVQYLERKEGITGTQPTTMQPKADTTSLVDRGATTRGQPITIDNILTQEDLEISFFKMDVNTDNFLTYPELKDFLGPNAPPEDRLMAFDKNGDGKLDLAEMSTALGFQEQS